MCGRGSEEMATADPGTMFSMLAGEMEAGAGLYCLGRDMRNTTSLFLMLLCMAALILGSVASAAPQLTRNMKSLSDTFMASRCLLGPGRSSGLSRMVAAGSVTSGCRLSPAPHTGAHGAGAHIFRYYYIGHFKNPANSIEKYAIC